MLSSCDKESTLLRHCASYCIEQWRAALELYLAVVVSSLQTLIKIIPMKLGAVRFPQDSLCFIADDQDHLRSL